MRIERSERAERKKKKRKKEKEEKKTCKKKEMDKNRKIAYESSTIDIRNFHI